MSNNEFGFDFGSMSVTRTCEEDSGAATISVKTPKIKISIRATKTGNVKIYGDGGNELTLVDKGYIEGILKKMENDL